MIEAFDWQGHRGARGLLPENTIPAFLRALSYPEITTLEMDVVITQDDRVLVSHDPWFSEEICDVEGKPSIRQLTLAEVQKVDCGQRGNARFPEQQKRPGTKPTLAAVFAAVDRYCIQFDRPAPNYNIELKYLPEWEPEFVPDRTHFAKLVLADVAAWGHPERVTLQCFDPPTLKVLHEMEPEITLAYLDEFPGKVRQKMDVIGFIPAIYSPYFVPLTAEIIAEVRQLDMKIIPWTVNEPADLQRIRKMDVDGIITDYPNRISDLK